MKRTHYLFWHGKRLLAEVMAETEPEARNIATTVTAVACSVGRYETPEEYRRKFAGARVQMIEVEHG